MTAKDIIVAMQTDSNWWQYKNSTIKPVGIVVHSTGTKNKTAKRYVNAPEQLGKNPNGNWFGSPKGAGGDPYALPHGVVGADKNGKAVACQILPWTAHCQGCGSGKYGSYNKLSDGTGYIQFEIAEGENTDTAYFNDAMNVAAELCAYLMSLYPDIKIENIVSHKEANARGYASGHGDPENYLKPFGKDMNWFRDKVKGYVKTGNAASSTVTKTVKFSPRLTAPSATDKHWIKSTRGGLNDCIEISGGSVLPNCVGYAWGRFYEIIGEKPRLSKNNAEMWYGNTADGYKRSQTPALGAVICWSKGVVGNEADGAGHVAIVEQILPNGDIVCSNSAYGGSRFYTQTYKKSDGYSFGAYKFQGFILPPVQIKNVTSAAASAPATAFKVGDIVEFTGSTNYKSSTGTRGIACKPGKAKITRIANGTAHPIHLIKDGSGSTVYGWVNTEDVQYITKKTVDEIAREVIRGDWGNGDVRKKRLIEAGYNYSEVQARVDKLI
ncbi:MAG: CHAP domain-containing protein [Duncaniella sp.]|nr:CHAP domain-containing protein [Duncaniella sp.]